MHRRLSMDWGVHAVIHKKNFSDGAVNTMVIEMGN